MPQDPANSHRALSPAEMIETDRPGQEPEPGIALCLSGGGYRAMLFHLGALWRLNEFGYLPKLDRVSSVSGGSITAGLLGLHWGALGFNAKNTAERFQQEMVDPIRNLAGKTIDISAITEGLLPFGSAADHVAGNYRKHLFDDKTLQDLPDRPRFVLNATNVQSMVLWRFSKPYMWDYRVGKVAAPKIELAVAVASSSAFPPVLSPMVLKLDESDYTPGTGLDLQRPPYTTKVVLTDGGVYDNLGLETAWKRYMTILVSDGGGAYAPEPNPKHDWVEHAYRVNSLIDNQVRSLRKRQVIGSFEAHLRRGTYWGIRSDIAKYGLRNALPCPEARTLALAGISTRLAALDDETQQRLINWGYAVCDAAMRKHVDVSLPVPNGFPYPNEGVG